MEERDHLRPHQYQDVYFEHDEPFVVDRHNKTSYLLYYGLGLTLLILILGFVVKIPREVELQFELKGGLKEEIGQYPYPIFVKERHVSIGEKVYVGSPIITITSEKIFNYLEELQRVKRDKERFYGSEQDLYNERRTLFDQQIKNEHRRIASLKNYRAKVMKGFEKENESLLRQVILLNNEYKRSKTLWQNQAISDQDLEQAERLLKEKENEKYEALQRYQIELVDMDDRLVSHENRIIEIKKNSKIDSLLRRDSELSLSQRESNIHAGLTLNYGPYTIVKDGLIINSDANGYVSLIHTADSQVEPGELVWKIEADKEIFKVSTEANSRQIGSLKEGQKVILKYESFPYFYYGTMVGEVENISSSTTVKGTYQVEITIKNYGNLEHSIKKGMVGNAAIITEDLPVFLYLIKDFLLEFDMSI